MNGAATLRARLAQNAPLVLPGVFDPFGALMAERAGFEGVYLSGASLAYSQLGRPDLGLIDPSDVVAMAQRIGERTTLPLVVDADTGFGGVLNVEAVVRRLGQVGAAAVQIEDQEFPKRCGHLRDKRLVPPKEMVAKVRAATAQRGEDGPLIIARTDAVAVEGLEAALDRAEAYLAAGADILFVEAPETDEHISLMAERFCGRAPLVLNQVEGGRTPLLNRESYARYGFSIVLFPGGLFRAVAFAMEEYFKSLEDNGSNISFASRMFDFHKVNEILGTSEELARAENYLRAEVKKDGPAMVRN